MDSKDVKGTRYCLNCRKEFVPQSRYNFICTGCYNNEVYRGAVFVPVNTQDGRVIRKNITNPNY